MIASFRQSATVFVRRHVFEGGFSASAPFAIDLQDRIGREHPRGAGGTGSHGAVRRETSRRIDPFLDTTKILKANLPGGKLGFELGEGGAIGTGPNLGDASGDVALIGADDESDAGGGGDLRGVEGDLNRSKPCFQEGVIVVVGIHQHPDAQLPEIVHTLRPPTRFLGARKSGQEHAGQDGDNGNHHQELDECKSLAVFGHDAQ